MVSRPINFDGLASDGITELVPDNYAGLDWVNFGSYNLPATGGGGYRNALESGDSVGLNYLSGSAARIISQDRHDDFDLNGGTFASAWNDDLTLKVFAYDDGDRVAAKTVVLDQDEVSVSFGKKFDSIDEVRFKATGGTDADPNDGGAGAYFGVDDLFLNL